MECGCVPHWMLRKHPRGWIEIVHSGRNTNGYYQKIVSLTERKIHMPVSNFQIHTSTGFSRLIRMFEWSDWTGIIPRHFAYGGRCQLIFDKRVFSQIFYAGIIPLQEPEAKYYQRTYFFGSKPGRMTFCTLMNYARMAIMQSCIWRFSLPRRPA